MATAILLPFVCQTCSREDHRQVNPGACDDCGAPMKMAQVDVSICHLITDPGHGWLVVTPARLASYGISESMISPYSYQDRDGGKIALEEDCDAGVPLTRTSARRWKPNTCRLSAAIATRTMCARCPL